MKGSEKTSFWIVELKGGKLIAEGREEEGGGGGEGRVSMKMCQNDDVDLL